MNAPGPLVLVADDDEDILELLVFRLERSGYRTAAARDGAEALRLVRELSPDLLVLDAMMPKRTGYEVVEELRAEDGTRALPVLLLTARVQEDDVARGLAAGADAYVAKPFNAHDLQARIAALLAAA